MEFRKECYVNLKNCACEIKYAKCCTKADAHNKMGFQYISISVTIHYLVPCVDPEGGQGIRTPPPLKNHKNIEFLSNTGPDPLKFSKLPNESSIQRWAIIGTPTKRHLKAFRWRAYDGPLLVIFGSSLPKKKKTKKRCQNSGPDQIRMEFRKDCFLNLNIWACDRKHAKHQ